MTTYPQKQTKSSGLWNKKHKHFSAFIHFSAFLLSRNFNDGKSSIDHRWMLAKRPVYIQHSLQPLNDSEMAVTVPISEL